MAVTVSVDELRDSVLRWANDGAGQALDALGQTVRDRAPVGNSDDPRVAGQHLRDTMEAIITGEGETWTGELAFTAEHASFVDEGRGPIEGNPLLYFYWQGQLISVHSVGPQEANPFFSEGVTDETWTEAVTNALDSIGSPA